MLIDVLSDITGDAACQAMVLEDLSTARNYRRWIVDLTMPHLGESPIEIGSGHGDYAAMWADHGLTVTATEGHPATAAQLTERFAADPRVSVRHLVAPTSETANHSAAVAVNVLEHIPDDVAALRSFADLVRPGGTVVVFVPAFRSLMSEFDHAVGHQRRYRKRDARAAFRAAGLQPVHLHYVNVAGFFAWLVMIRLMHGRPRTGFGLTVFDRIVVPVMRRVEALVQPPFGQSLLAVGRKPEQGAQ